ncbi:MAG: hypothetical protein WCY09_06155 [Candidatus Omnitrophota bacterium]
MLNRKRGLALIAAVMLIVFVSIAVLGLSVFIVQWIGQINADQISSRCVYNALAGVNYSIYQYRNSTSLINGTININVNNSFRLSTVLAGGGGGASSAMVLNATAARLGNNNRRLLGVTVRNSSANAVTIDRMIVSWSINNRTMSQIRINGNTVWSGIMILTPANVNITNTVIPANTTYPIDLIQFNSSMIGATITISFVMTDGTTTSACVAYPVQGSVCTQPAGSLTINSMGKVSGSNIYRTVSATYNIAGNNIADWSGINAVVP